MIFGIKDSFLFSYSIISLIHLRYIGTPKTIALQPKQIIKSKNFQMRRSK